MPHMETFMAAVLGRDWEVKSRWYRMDVSWSNRRTCNRHVSPEAYEGGNLALIRNNDIIHINIEERKLEVDVSEEEFERRKKEFLPIVKPAKGWLSLYRRQCTSAHRGATVYWEKE